MVGWAGPDHTLIELHGGRMRAESAGAGLGSTFTVYLPMQQPEPRGAVTLPGTRAPLARTLDLEGVHVLIVDDDGDARELLRTMLATTGARISEADSARNTLRLVAEDRPDIILADVAMPGQDGYSMMRALRGLPDLDGRQVRAVAVSAYARREDKQRALKSGFNDHVGKPVQIDELFDALERIWLQGPPALLNDTEPGAKVH
jgi:CheY-like chemotaxis protein